jgi:hypothetical protein
MILFGTLCLVSMVVGVGSVFTGITRPFIHPTIDRVGNKVADSLEKVSREEFGYTDEDGLLQDHVLFSLGADLPFILDYEDLGQVFLMNTVFSLTQRESKALTTLTEPLAYFDQLSRALPLPPIVRATQRKKLLDPILDFLKKIPAPRRVET